MHSYPRLVYALYPFDENGLIAGVYVGSAHDLEKRIGTHLTNHGGNQLELHELMRNNGFSFQILDFVPNRTLSHIEYDWIDFFSRVNLRLFNERKWDGDARNIYQMSTHPYWNGKSVTQMVMPHQTRIFPSGVPT